MRQPFLLGGMSHRTTHPPPGDLPFELVLSTPDGTRCIPLATGTTASVGRGDDNLIRLDHGSVSRAHALIHAHPEGVEVEDLGSSNGTTVIPLVRSSRSGAHDLNGSLLRLRPHERRALAAGDVVRIGPALICLQRIRTEAPVRALAPAEPVVVLDSDLRKTYELAHRAATSDISILITGETGVGKEALARRVHELSKRKSAPFWLLNCAELSEPLLDRAFFAQVHSAPRGAGRDKLELFELTRGGTIFLDEVGQLPLGTQAKLQRVFEQGTVSRSGGNSEPIDVRFVSATNLDLMQAVRTGRFRADLFYRIGGLVLNVPPLRKRQLEIEPLARHFLRDFSARLGHPEPRLTSAALEALHSYAWPGNVRELKNVIERAALLAESGEILADHVFDHREPPKQGAQRDEEDIEAPTVRLSLPVPAPHVFETAAWRRNTHAPDPHEPSAELESFSEDAERDRYLEALKSCAGNQTRAAALLGISRKVLITRLNNWNVPRPKRRPRRSHRPQ